MTISVTLDSLTDVASSKQYPDVPAVLSCTKPLVVNGVLNTRDMVTVIAGNYSLTVGDKALIEFTYNNRLYKGDGFVTKSFLDSKLQIAVSELNLKLS